MSIKDLDFEFCRTAFFNEGKFAGENGSLVLYDSSNYPHTYDRNTIIDLVKSGRMSGIIISDKNVQEFIMALLDVQMELSRPDFSSEEKFKPLLRINTALESILATT